MRLYRGGPLIEEVRICEASGMHTAVHKGPKMGQLINRFQSNDFKIYFSISLVEEVNILD